MVPTNNATDQVQKLIDTLSKVNIDAQVDVKQQANLQVYTVTLSAKELELSALFETDVTIRRLSTKRTGGVVKATVTILG